MNGSDQEKTGLGNYFVANYPPFAAWQAEQLPAAWEVLRSPPSPLTPLGLYVHIPFCRKRCQFCYFRVYVDKNAREVETYLNSLVREIELYQQTPFVQGRPLQFIYFGGGTPSFLSATQIHLLFASLQGIVPLTQAEEITFECEPGTLQEHKLFILRKLGVTRLSLGIENFSDRILELNGRAHLSAEIFQAFSWARQLQFPQINIDLIAGMVGETWDNWRNCVRQTIELGPDSVTIYQLELPFNTVFSQQFLQHDQGQPAAEMVADWPTKRAWVDYAFTELAQAGYAVSSAYTMVRDKQACRFVYRDSLWHGADMLGTGVASFGHLNGVHVQNVDSWDKYVECLQKKNLPLGRALALGPRQRLLREMVLQLKTGQLQTAYFQRKFGVNISAEFAEGFHSLARDGNVVLADGTITLTRQGLLQVDRLLPTFFEPEYRGTRYA